MRRNSSLPSFGRELFLGHLRLDLIHPQPQQRVLEGRYRRLEEGIIDPGGEGPLLAPEPEAAAEAARRS